MLFLPISSSCFLKISILIFVDGYLFSLNLWYIIDTTPWSLGRYLIVFSANEGLIMKNKITKKLIIDAANEKIIFKIIDNDKIYTNDYENSRKNFDKFAVLLFNFLNKKTMSFDIIDKVLVNLGPGKYSSIRTSISTLKAINLIYKFKIYGFSSKDVEKYDYSNVLELLKKGKLIKNLIKPLYLS